MYGDFYRRIFGNDINGVLFYEIPDALFGIFYPFSLLQNRQKIFLHTVRMHIEQQLLLAAEIMVKPRFGDI